MSAEKLTSKTADMLAMLAVGVSPATVLSALELVALGARLNQTLDLIDLLDARGAIDLGAKQMLYRNQVMPMRDLLDQLRSAFMDCYTIDAKHRS